MPRMNLRSTTRGMTVPNKTVSWSQPEIPLLQLDKQFLLHPLLTVQPEAQPVATGSLVDKESVSRDRHDEQRTTEGQQQDDEPPQEGDDQHESGTIRTMGEESKQGEISLHIPLAEAVTDSEDQPEEDQAVQPEDAQEDECGAADAQEDSGGSEDDQEPASGSDTEDEELYEPAVGEFAADLRSDA